MIMANPIKSKIEEEKQKSEAVSTGPAPRALPTYDSVSETKRTTYPSEAKPLLRREIVKR